MKNNFIRIIVIVFGFTGAAVLAAPVQQTAKAKKPANTIKSTEAIKAKKPIKKSKRIVKKNQKKRLTNKELNEKVERLEKSLAVFTQNRDNPKGEPNWFKHFRLSGLLNVEVYDRTKPDFGTKSTTRSTQVALPTAKLNIDAFLNAWVNGHVGFFYADSFDRYYLTNSATTSGVVVDEAYATVKNFKKLPFYLRAGQQYLPFGAYNRYPITKTLTQELSEIRATAAELGFVDQSGLYGAVAVFHGLKKQSNNRRTRINNYIAALGYENRNHPVGYDFGIGYLNNMSDVGRISYNIPNNYFVRRVGAISLQADTFTGPFDLALRYVSATRQFSPTDFPYQVRPGRTRGAKPSAETVQAGYSFKLKGYASKIVLSYQHSREGISANSNSVNSNRISLPKHRISLGYGMRVLRNTIVAFEFRRDKDYSKRHAGTNAYNNAVTLRLTALF